MWRCLVLYQQISKGPRVVLIVFFSLLSLASFGRPFSISTPPRKVLIKILSMGRLVVSHKCVFKAVCDPASESGPWTWTCPKRPNRVRFNLGSRKYHTRSIDRFPTHLPSKTRPKNPWSGAWISLHQHYDHARRIFGIDGHFRWSVQHSVFAATDWCDICGKQSRTPRSPSYLCRWLRIQWFLMYD